MSVPTVTFNQTHLGMYSGTLCNIWIPDSFEVIDSDYSVIDCKWCQKEAYKVQHHGRFAFECGHLWAFGTEWDKTIPTPESVGIVSDYLEESGLDYALEQLQLAETTRTIFIDDINFVNRVGSQ